MPILQKMPIVDAAPVVHARWELTQHLHGVLHGRPLDLVISKCSACGKFSAGNTTMKYCMNCGARMDGAQERTESDSRPV